MKQNILISTICIFLILNLVLLFKLRIKDEAIAESNNLSKFYELKTKSTDDYFSSFIKASLLNEGKSIENLLLTNPDGDTCKLLDINISTPTIVFAYSESHCQQCVESIIDLLTSEFDLKNSVINPSILFIGSYSVSRDMKLFLNSQQLNVNSFSIVNYDKIFNLTDEPNPVLFILTPSHTINNYFQCSEDKHDLIKEYIELVKSKIFRNEK